MMPLENRLNDYKEGDNHNEKHSTFGIHIVCDMYGIPDDKLFLLTNKKEIETLLIKAAKKSKANIVDVHTPEFFVKCGGGLTSYVTVMESTFEIHTYPEHKTALISIHTCGSKANPELGIKYLQKKLTPSILNAIKIERGNVQNLEIGSPSSKHNQQPFGYHILIDAYKCNPKKINDLNCAYDLLDSLPKIVKMKRLMPPYVSRKEKGQGLIGGIDLERDSSADINTSTEKRLLLFDLFLTQEFVEPLNLDKTKLYFQKIKEKVIGEVKKIYFPKDIDYQFLWRGSDY